MTTLKRLFWAAVAMFIVAFIIALVLVLMRILFWMVIVTVVGGGAYILYLIATLGKE